MTCSLCQEAACGLRARATGSFRVATGPSGLFKSTESWGLGVLGLCGDADLADARFEERGVVRDFL